MSPEQYDAWYETPRGAFIGVAADVVPQGG